MKTVNVKEWKEMNFKEKVIDTISGLWNFIGLIFLLCIIVSVPFVIIQLITIWLIK